MNKVLLYSAGVMGASAIGLGIQSYMDKNSKVAKTETEIESARKKNTVICAAGCAGCALLGFAIRSCISTKETPEGLSILYF